MMIYGKRNLNELKNILSEIVYMSFSITSFWILPIYKVEIKYCPIKE